MHTNDKNTQTHPRDIRFTVLSVLGMIFIVDGHLNNSFLDWGGMFPYYSFHVPLFLFISGYFYRPDFPSEGICRFTTFSLSRSSPGTSLSTTWPHGLFRLFFWLRL